MFIPGIVTLDILYSLARLELSISEQLVLLFLILVSGQQPALKMILLGFLAKHSWDKYEQDVK